MDKICVSGLKINTIVGVFEWEREVPQLVVLDLEMGVDIRAASKTDGLADTVDYKAVSDRLTTFVKQSQFQLIETIAERCAEIILSEFNVKALTLRVSKPGAIPAADTVSVEIRRQRDA